MIARLIRAPGLYLFIAILYSIGLWKISVPLTGDQKTYISIAMEMTERSEWVIPYLFGKANFLKPPLEYWATIVGWKLFGFNLFGALFPSVLALIASSFLVSRISDFIFKNKNGSMAALLFAGTIGTMTYGTTAQMEIWIVLFYLLAWERWLNGKFWTAFLVVGFMAWTKGPLYPVLWVLSTWIWTLLEKRIQIFKEKKYWLSVAFGILVGLTWYALAARTHLQEMKEVFLLRENVGKIQTTQGTPGKLWADFSFSLFPLLIFFFYALIAGGRNAFKTLNANARNFILAYAVLPALFFTFFPYRVGTYLYLLTPIIAWWTVHAYSSAEKISVKTMQFFGGFTALLAITLSFLIFRLTQGNWIGFEIGFPLVVCFGVWSFGFWKNNLKVIAIVGLLIVNLIRMGAVEIGEKDLMGLRVYQAEHPGKLAYAIDDPDIWHEFGYLSAALSEDIDRIDVTTGHFERLNAYLQDGGALILSDLQTDPNHVLFKPSVETVCQPWPRLRKRTKFPVLKLVREGLSIEDPALLRIFQICRLK